MIELNNGLSIPEIGFGTFPQKESLLESAKYAYSVGYRLFDISDNYKNEEFLGRAIHENPEKFGGAIVITKFSQATRTYELSTCFVESQNKLYGRINIYLLHWPYPFLWKEQWKRMEMLYDEGKCQAIGVCNFEVDKLKELLTFCKIKPVINQIERHPLFQQNDIVGFCKENDIQVMSYSPVARHDSSLYESEILKQIGQKYNKTISQVILRWDIDTGTIPIPGSKSQLHIKENMDVFDFKLTKEDIKLINSLECGKRIRFDPSKRFTIKQKIKFLLVRAKLL